MSRVQLALRVADLEGSVAFYSRLFGAEPAKRRPGYANFAITEPPLKLVLIEGQAGEPTRMDHLGVEVETTEEVTAATARLAAEGLATATEEDTACCYAVQDKVWVTGPGQEPWEVYVVKADADTMGDDTIPAPACCVPADEAGSGKPAATGAEAAAYRASIPGYVAGTSPGDVIAFDLHTWHASFGGRDRLAWTAVYQRCPETAQERDRTLRSVSDGFEQAFRGFDRDRYPVWRDWLAGAAGHPRRAPVVERMRQAGVLDLPGAGDGW